MFSESLKLLDIEEDINQFVKSSNKVFEFLENLGFREIELFSFGHIGNFFFGLLVTLSVISVESDTLV